jgi:hypothetical protein
MSETKLIHLFWFAGIGAGVCQGIGKERVQIAGLDFKER